jgi:hypothetical protein
MAKNRKTKAHPPVGKSGNRKLRPNTKNSKVVIATSRSADTCAADCPFNRKGINHKPSEGGTACYAVNKGPGGKSYFDRAEETGNDTAQEAFDELERIVPKNNVLVRHLISGDIEDPSTGDDYIPAANAFHEANPQAMGQGYTHNYENLDPTMFHPNLVMRASVETEDEAQKASAAGWPVAIASPVDDLLSARGAKLTSSTGRSLPIIRCPAETHPNQVGCGECRVCTDPTKAVEFGIHGNTTILGNIVREKREAEQSQVTGSGAPDGDSTDGDFNGTRTLTQLSMPRRNNAFTDGVSDRV